MLKGHLGIPNPTPSFYKWRDRDPEKLSKLPKTTQLVSSRARVQMRSQCPSLAQGGEHVDRGYPDLPACRPGLDSLCHSTLSILNKS